MRVKAGEAGEGTDHGEKYCLVRLLGEGGASEVYLARDLRLQKWWAVKKMKNREGGRVMLLREAELLSRLEHPALPRVVDWIEEGEEICLVMDFVEGRSLEQFLDKADRRTEGQSAAGAWNCVRS